MKRFEEVCEVKTQPIYYTHIELEDYSVATYLSKEYVVGTRRKFDYGESEFGSYENYMRSTKELSGTEVLQYALSLGYELYPKQFATSCTRPERQEQIAMEFCARLGLNNNDMLRAARAAGGEGQPPFPWGCSISEIVNRLSLLYHVYEISATSAYRDIRKDEIIFVPLALAARLNSRLVYSTTEKKMKTILLADSVLDALGFQLGKILSDGVYTRKCANPACSRIIIGGRSDKKTCSSSCRKAYERYKKGYPR